MNVFSSVVSIADTNNYNHVNYRPWVGSNYYNAPVRILFVGVKHYSDDPSSVSPDATTECVNYYLNDDEYENYFDAFDKIVEVVKDDGLTNKEAWNDIAFYNYTQVVLPNETSRPTYQQIEQSKDAYIEVLLRLKPHKVIFWGKWIYNQVLVGYGIESQYIDGHLTWMTDLHQLDESIAPNSHIIHDTYINDPARRDFSVSKFRALMRSFISQPPAPYRNPHIKRRITQLMRFLQIEVDGFQFNGLDFSDVLSKAIACGLLRFNPASGVIDNQRLTAKSSFATSYFAYRMREAMTASSSSPSLDEAARTAFSDLLNGERYDITLSPDGLSITFRGRNKKRVNHIYQTLFNARRTNTNEKIKWEVFERIFRQKNIRQNISHVGRDKDYAKEIDEFFGR